MLCAPLEITQHMAEIYVTPNDCTIIWCVDVYCIYRFPESLATPLVHMTVKYSCSPINVKNNRQFVVFLSKQGVVFRLPKNAIHVITSASLVLLRAAVQTIPTSVNFLRRSLLNLRFMFSNTSRFIG